MTQNNSTVMAMERLRVHMKLPVLDIINLLGITRPTYSQWKKGGVVRGSNKIKLEDTLIKLLWVARHPEWQKYDKSYLTNSRRRMILEELLSRQKQLVTTE